MSNLKYLNQIKRNINKWIDKIPWNKINFLPLNLKDPMIKQYGEETWAQNREKFIFAYELARKQQTKFMSGFFALSCIFVAILIYFKPAF